MSLFELPYALDLVLADAGIARPDGGVAVAIDGRELLARVGASGHLDFDSIRVLNLGASLRDAPVQFVPDADFDPVHRPCGQLWFRMWKYTWDDSAFPRRFRVCFDRLRDGGKKPWARCNADQPGTPLRLEAGADSVAVRREDGRQALGFSFPANRKPSLHPLTTPSGAVVTASTPRDHPWHRGVWFGWTGIACAGLQVPGYCAWVEPHGAVIRDLGLSRLTAGPVVQGWTSRSLWCTPDGEPLLAVDWRTEHQAVDAGWNWTDLTLTVGAARAGVVLGSDYGHLSARAAMDLRDEYILDSAAAGVPITAHNRDDIEHDWAGYGGITPGGAAVSLILLDHPGNPGGRPRRDYFCERRQFPIEEDALFIAVSMNPLRGRPLTLDPARPLTWRYRIVTSDRRLTPEYANYHAQNWRTPFTASWATPAG